MQRAGYAVIAAKKCPGSVLEGIRGVKAMNLHIHHRSGNMQNEARQYKWFETKEGVIADKPIDLFNYRWIRFVDVIVHELGTEFAPRASDTVKVGVMASGYRRDRDVSRVRERVYCTEIKS